MSVYLSLPLSLSISLSSCLYLYLSLYLSIDLALSLSLCYTYLFIFAIFLRYLWLLSCPHLCLVPYCILPTAFCCDMPQYFHDLLWHPALAVGASQLLGDVPIKLLCDQLLQNQPAPTV